MTKLPIYLTALALCANAGVLVTPAITQPVWADGGTTTVLLEHNQRHPLVEFRLMDGKASALSFTFNPENNPNFRLKRTVFATYRYTQYPRSAVEAAIEDLKSTQQPAWAEYWLAKNVSASQGTYAVDNYVMKDWKYSAKLSSSLTGTLYYALEYADVEHSDSSSWLIGRLDYRDCLQTALDRSMYASLTTCAVQPNQDATSWVFTRTDPSITSTVMPYQDALYNYLHNQLQSIGVSADSPSNTTEADHERLYGEVVRIRGVMAETGEDNAQKLLKESRETYKAIYGYYEEGYDPNAETIKPTEPVDPVDPTLPTNPTDPTPGGEDDKKEDDKNQGEGDDENKDNDNPATPGTENPPTTPSTSTGRPSGSYRPSSGSVENINAGTQAQDQPKTPTATVAISKTPATVANTQKLPTSSQNLAKNDQQSVEKTEGDAENSLKNDQGSETAAGTDKVAVPALNEEKNLAVVKKSNSWLIVAIITGSVAAVVGWLGFRAYKRRH